MAEGRNKWLKAEINGEGRIKVVEGRNKWLKAELKWRKAEING
ncbi:hypothetical protein [Peribacillus sp. TH14]|nr:hypothetical protein [Peribacillus sp. TH14]